MRRGTIITGIILSLAVAALMAPAAFADPGVIAEDLKDGRLDGSYTQQELTDYLNNAMTEGYGNPIITVVVPPGQPGPPGAPGVPGAPGEPGAPGAAGAPAAAPAAPAVGVAGARQSQTAPAAQAPAGQTAGVKKTQTAPSAVAPIRATRQVGSLPFTGVDLALIVAGGLFLLALGAGARRLAGQQRII